MLRKIAQVNSNSTPAAVYDGPAIRTRSKKILNSTPGPGKHQPLAPAKSTRPSSRTIVRTRSGQATTTRATESSKSKKKEPSGRAKRTVTGIKATGPHLSPRARAGLRDQVKASPGSTNKAPLLPTRRLPQRSSKIAKADNKDAFGNSNQSKPTITAQPTSGHRLVAPPPPSTREVATTSATTADASNKEVASPPRPANVSIGNSTLTPRDENIKAPIGSKLRGPIFTGCNAIADALNSANLENYNGTHPRPVRRAVGTVDPVETDAKKATVVPPLPSRRGAGTRALPVPPLPYRKPPVPRALPAPTPPSPPHQKSTATQALPVPPLPYCPRGAQAANGAPPLPYRKAPATSAAPALSSRKVQGGRVPAEMSGAIPSTQQAPRIVRSDFKVRKTITFEIKVEEDDDAALLRAGQRDDSESDKESYVSDESSEEEIYGGGIAAWIQGVREAGSRNPGKRSYQEDDSSESETSDNEDELQNTSFERPMKKMKVEGGKSADEDAPAKYTPQVENNKKPTNKTSSDGSLEASSEDSILYHSGSVDIWQSDSRTSPTEQQ